MIIACFYLKCIDTSRSAADSGEFDFCRCDRKRYRSCYNAQTQGVRYCHEKLFHGICKISNEITTVTIIIILSLDHCHCQSTIHVTLRLYPEIRKGIIYRKQFPDRQVIHRAYADRFYSVMTFTIECLVCHNVIVVTKIDGERREIR